MSGRVKYKVICFPILLSYLVLLFTLLLVPSPAIYLYCRLLLFFLISLYKRINNNNKMLTKAVGYHNDSKAANAAARVIKQSLKALPKSVRGHLVAVIGEFVGTLLFLFFAFAGTQVANVSSNTNTGTTVITETIQKTPQQLLYISLAFGFSLAVNAWTFFRISGGLFSECLFPFLQCKTSANVQTQILQ